MSLFPKHIPLEVISTDQKPVFQLLSQNPNKETKPCVGCYIHRGLTTKLNQIRQQYLCRSSCSSDRACVLEECAQLGIVAIADTQAMDDFSIVEMGAVFDAIDTVKHCLEATSLTTIEGGEACLVVAAAIGARGFASNGGYHSGDNNE